MKYMRRFVSSKINTTWLFSAAVATFCRGDPTGVDSASTMVAFLSGSVIFAGGGRRFVDLGHTGSNICVGANLAELLLSWWLL
jgi:hypothetical protein